MNGLDDDRELPVEIVHLHVYDIGRSVDLKQAASLIPVHPDLGLAKKRGTPASLTLPKPLVLALNAEGCDAEFIERMAAFAKIYDDGALTIIVRYRTTASFKSLASFEDMKLGDGLTVSAFAEKSFYTVCDAIKSTVKGFKESGISDRETYTAYCLLECPGDDPEAFLARNRDVAASLISGEKPGILHKNQIDQVLADPFCYGKGDLAVFDMDRCLIIDPARDYEDLLLIAEHANYRLNELRVLDSLLDTWLEEAEHDVRRAYFAGKRTRSGGLKLKIAKLQSLRFDALFTLENLDNSSKIIGDYYLGTVYDRLCKIFNTDGWKISVERRLDALQNVYEMIKYDSGENRMLKLEIIFIAVCIIFPLLQIVQAMVQ